jgi:hypothetical protein
MAVDADAGFGYLFGWQQVWADVIPGPSTIKHEYKSEYSPSQPMFGGKIELTPIPLLSFRTGGSVSLSRNRTVYGRELGTISLPWEVASEIKTWEAAGLINLWRGAGYRFSLVGGYREQYWDYSGDPVGDGAIPGAMNDEINNYAPFMGLQTAMFFPLWKARFEVSGSPFMLQKVNNNVWQGSEFQDYRAQLDEGGLIEFDFEGSTILYSMLRLALYGHYSYMELTGDASLNGSRVSNNPDFKFNSVQSAAEFGLKFNVNF